LVCHEKRPLKQNRANKKSSGALVTNSLSRSQGTGSILLLSADTQKSPPLNPWQREFSPCDCCAATGKLMITVTFPMPAHLLYGEKRLFYLTHYTITGADFPRPRPHPHRSKKLMYQ